MKLTILVAVLVACSQPAGRDVKQPPPPPPSENRLVVLLVIDQWPEWAFEAKRDHLGGGFARLLAEGEWRVGQHPAASTLTAPGHALLGTGQPSALSGILGNVWWRREFARELNSTEAEDGSLTTKWLRVKGLGDLVAAKLPGGKAVGVALKDRAAILPLGHTGVSIFYAPKTATWNRVVLEPPGTVRSELGWVAAHDRAHPVEPRLHEAWVPSDQALVAKLANVEDDQQGEVGEKGFGATFPHDPSLTKNPADAVFAMPLGADLVFELATAAIEGEGLATDATPDLLVVSISAHDYIGHGWGHESWEAWDFTLRLDHRIGQFTDDLDRLVGPGQWSMIVTSDHGASPLPERLGGGRMTHHQIQIAANNAASATLGPGEWIANAHYPNVFFTPAMLSQPPRELESATKRVVNALRSFPGLADVDRTALYAGNCDSKQGNARAICLTLDPERSGDVFYIPAKGWIMEEEDERLATAHGSLNDYDRLVPVILLPPGRTRHAAHTAPAAEPPVDMRTIAATVASFLGIQGDPTTL